MSGECNKESSLAAEAVCKESRLPLWRRGLEWIPGLQRWLRREAPAVRSASDAISRLLLSDIRHQWPDQAEPLLRTEQLHWQVGQQIWLQGANGSGKSTLMRLIAGLEPLQAGDIYRAASSGGLLRVCYLHQTPYLFSGTVLRNLQFVIRSLKGEARQRAENALELGLQLAGLSALKEQSAVTLSGGERQRLALLRAWLLQPDVLLLDEPAANLDEASVVLMHRLVVDLLAKGTTVMVSSHQQNLLTDLCNTRWEISSGLLYASTDEELPKRQSPEEAFPGCRAIP